MKSCPTCKSSYPAKYSVCPQDGTGLVDVATWPEGTLVRSKYRILGKVGQGGMGTVYKALHLAFDELRALKVISPELASDETFLRRFKHEAVITRKLQHPNAVRVDDIDEAEDGRPFIVMEYIEGRSLKTLIREHGPLAVPRVCSIVRQVAAALEAAHRLGMVHRDIKPDNIVLVAPGPASGPAAVPEVAKVLDFGIAKLKEARLGETGGMTLTGTGLVIGTPQYMSPEQAMGKRGDELDARSDLYSLGIVMYQMLTGDLPFKADTTMEMLLAQMQRLPTPIKALRPDLQIPDSIAGLVMKTLEKNRDMRPSSAKALVEELDRAERERPSPALAPTVVAALRETVRIAPQAQASQVVSIPSQPAAPARAASAGPVTQAGLPAADAAPPPSAAAHQTPLPPRPLPARVYQPVHARPRVSRLGIWLAVAVLVVGVGAGAWFFAGRITNVVSPSPGVESNVSSGAAVPGSSGGQQPQQPQHLKTTSVEAPSSGPLVGTATASPALSSSEAGQKVAAPPPTSSSSHAPKPAVDPRRVSSAIALGDFYLNHGDYDKAIDTYKKGLRLDPTNAILQSKLRRAQNAKAAEQRVLR